MFFVILQLSLAFAGFLGQISHISNDMLTVYLFPHSHDDVGWVKTADEYYTMKNGVRQIINSYMECLIKDQNKKFSQVEIAFFKRWWNEQNETMQLNVKKLLANGQLEFLNGGWCMNDEATAYYEDIIDQMTVGHQFLLEYFDYVPSVGWQVDPFGHSSAQAELFSMMGFNAWFMGRIDEDDKQNRIKNKGLEMIMHPQTQAGVDYPILTHVNYYGFYSSPKGFDFDTNNHHGQITDQNVVSKSNEFVNYFKKQSQQYRGNILAHTLGMDFEWSNAPSFFQNIDKLINYISSKQSEFEIEIKYGTPQDYINAINAQNVSYPTKQDDFFPYADMQNGYWTGYFTSRVAFKGYIKKAGRYAQVIKRFISQLMISKQNDFIQANPPTQQLLNLAEILGTCQHHDAVTGTAKKYVTDDYIKSLTEAIEQMDKYLSLVLQSTVKSEINEINVNYQQCNFNQTASQCQVVYQALQNNKIVLVTLLDAKINHKEQEIIRIKVPNLNNLTIIDSNNTTLKGELFCVNQNDTNDCDLYFFKDAHLGFTDYIKIFASKQSSVTVIKGEAQPFSASIPISLQNKRKFQLNYGYYVPYTFGGQQSGAYIFRPESSAVEPTSYGAIQSSIKYSGEMVEIIYFKRNFTETWIKSFSNETDIYHIDTFIGSIPDKDSKGKEIVLLIDTGISNENIFYTDSNGLELQKRKVNHRDTWQLRVSEQVSGNYYPVNGMILIQDEKTQEAVALLNDRAQGGTSLQKGRLELMIHRRLFRDDAKGVNENLNEVEMVKEGGVMKSLGLQQIVQHKLVFFNRKTNPNAHREQQFLQDFAPLQYYTTSESKSFEQTVQTISKTFLNNVVQQQENLIKFYLQPIHNEYFIFRVHNMKENQNITLDLPNSLNFVETTLTGNQKLSDWKEKKLQWNQEEYIQKDILYDENVVGPLQIKTYIVNGF